MVLMLPVVESILYPAAVSSDRRLLVGRGLPPEVMDVLLEPLLQEDMPVYGQYRRRQAGLIDL